MPGCTLSDPGLWSNTPLGDSSGVEDVYLRVDDGRDELVGGGDKL